MKKIFKTSRKKPRKEDSVKSMTDIYIVLFIVKLLTDIYNVPLTLIKKHYFYLKIVKVILTLH